MQKALLRSDIVVFDAFVPNSLFLYPQRYYISSYSSCKTKHARWTNVCTDNHQSIVRTHVENIRNAIGGNIVNTYTHTHRNRRHASSFESCCIISCLIILKEKLRRDYEMCQSLHQQNEGILTMTGRHKR